MIKKKEKKKHTLGLETRLEPPVVVLIVVDVVVDVVDVVVLNDVMLMVTLFLSRLPKKK